MSQAPLGLLEGLLALGHPRRVGTGREDASPRCHKVHQQLRQLLALHFDLAVWTWTWTRRENAVHTHGTRQALCGMGEGRGLPGTVGLLSGGKDCGREDVNAVVAHLDKILAARHAVARRGHELERRMRLYRFVHLRQRQSWLPRQAHTAIVS
jgi:hypothetical protein